MENQWSGQESERPLEQDIAMGEGNSVTA